MEIMISPFSFWFGGLEAAVPICAAVVDGNMRKGGSTSSIEWRTYDTSRSFAWTFMDMNSVYYTFEQNATKSIRLLFNLSLSRISLVFFSAS
ncbi:hypothetical protein B0T19DRAFT_418125 [Cercophora scortea]|uniref:Secreted protein n=1 Tax=Cercophora scortea TaxID=314031 RepID=A0AAE0IY59_9PEZI|nr:hypothetical protein B0T19DRAFT_418125 [Cercophora scortea]